MFQPAPRRHRRLPTTGTMVSYAEVKSYLSKREIPQLFESLMAGLMYHRPENHMGYLQSCLEEVKSNSDTKIQWSTFVNAKKRKSKEILPPLTPKNQDSFSSSWSDNSRQSTPLPPISARTRMRASMEQQDFRNTYILYHNPPPILAKPKVPVVSVLGGLGSKIDELCERVVGRLRGVVHISTCSMLKTRMTIEGFYRVTSVPACAVVDSVLQAMSMVQSASALLVAGFPRNRGDIEEYRSRRVRMDGVVLVDFEEEALRRFLEHEVSNGIVRTSETESELERFKQDIISVAEYYDEKELLTVVMGDQDLEEIIEDLILAIDKVIETRKNLAEEDATDGKKSRECNSPCKALMPSPDRLERPSTVEIRDATEEDIKSIEEEAKKVNTEDIDQVKDDQLSQEESDLMKENKNNGNEISDENVLEAQTGEENDNKEVEEDSKKDEPTISESNDQLPETSQKEMGQENEEENGNKLDENAEESEHESSPPGKDENPENDKQDIEELTTEKQDIPLVFAIENINADYDEIKNLIANDLEMCFIDFYEFMRNDENDENKFDNEEALSMLSGILKQDSVSYSNGFFIYKFPFSLLNENFIEQLIILGNVHFVCKTRENKSDSESEKMEDDQLINSSISGKVTIIFVTESNATNELRTALQGIISNKTFEEEKHSENVTDKTNESPEKSSKECENLEDQINEEPENKGEESKKENILKSQQNEDEYKEAVNENEIITDDKTEDSTGKDIEDLISDDTLNEGIKPPESLKTDENQDINPDETGVDDTHSQASTIASVGDETKRERAVLERQSGLELETDNASLHSQSEKNKTLIRQSTYSANEEIDNDEIKETSENDVAKESVNEVIEDTAIEKNEDNVEMIEDATNNEKENPSEILEGDSMKELKTEDAENEKSQINEEENFTDGEKSNNEKECSENGKDKEVDIVENEDNIETESAENEIIKEVDTTENAEKDNENEENLPENEENLPENEENLPENEENLPENHENKRIEVGNDIGENSAGNDKNGEKELGNDENEENEAGIDQNENKEAETQQNEENTETQQNEENAETQQNEENAETQQNEENGETRQNEENGETQQNEENGETDETRQVNKINDGAIVEEESIHENETPQADSENLSDNGNKDVTEEENNNESSVKEKLNDTKDDTVDSNAEGNDEIIKNDTENSTKEKLDDTNDIVDSNAEENAEIKHENEENLIEEQSTPQKGEDENASEQVSENEANNTNATESEELPDIESKVNEDNQNIDQKNDDVKENGDENNNSEKNKLENTNEEESAGHEPISIEKTEKDTPEEKSESESHEKITDKELSTSLKISKGETSKVLDNDSDSNDENITIETKAEIHAVDCVTSPTTAVEESNSKSIHENVENEETKTDPEIQNIENEDLNSSNNKKNEILNKEIQNDDERESEVLSIKDIDSIGSERYSGKRQERNGSGILDDSRQQDERESEEPQERSSSSSRGEL